MEAGSNSLPASKCHEVVKFEAAILPGWRSNPHAHSAYIHGNTFNQRFSKVPCQLVKAIYHLMAVFNKLCEDTLIYLSKT